MYLIIVLNEGLIQIQTQTKRQQQKQKNKTHTARTYTVNNAKVMKTKEQRLRTIRTSTKSRE